MNREQRRHRWKYFVRLRNDRSKVGGEFYDEKEWPQIKQLREEKKMAQLEKRIKKHELYLRGVS